MRTREKRRVITSGYAVSLGVMKCSKTDCVDDGCTTVNILKTTELQL